MTEELERRARGLATARERRILGITGPPGAGKSTLARELVNALGPLAALVPMDGFHLSGSELERLGRADRKGAPDTFDADGYVALLERLRAANGPTVPAPAFRREIEEPVAEAIAVPGEVSLVVTEGNYLLVDDGRWAAVAPLLHECWYVDLDEPTGVARLTARHEAHGRSPRDARAWVRDVDEPNAAVVRSTRDRAELVVGAG